MKFGPWLYLIMVIAGVFSYYASEPLMKMMPQDRDGNVIWPYQTFGVLLNYGWCLAAFGWILASYMCEKELISRHKQRND